MERCKSAIGQKTAKKLANNTLRTAGEHLGHFLNKIRSCIEVNITISVKR